MELKKHQQTDANKKETKSQQEEGKWKSKWRGKKKKKSTEKKSKQLKTSSSPKSELLVTASRTGLHLSITSRHTTQLLTHSGRPMFAQYLSIKQQNVLASISPVKELNQTQFTVNAWKHLQKFPRVPKMTLFWIWG